MIDEAAKTDTQTETKPEAKPARAAKSKTVRVRSLVGPFTVLHTNTVIGEGVERKVELDPWIQLQIDTGKLEIVVD